MNMSNLFFVDKCFSYLPQANPFSTDGYYNDNWVFLRLIKTDEYNLMTGADKVFGLTISTNCDHWHFSMMDFINYQKIYNRNIIMIVDKTKYQEAVERYQGHSIVDRFARIFEPEVFVHSTTYDSYKNILKDGYIKSWNILKEQKYINEDKPIGHCLGDPSDFSDYVMLGGGVSPEIVISSKQKGYICMDTECEYEPGARFYFNTKTLAENGLLVRDGAHYKIKDMLSLEYCEIVVTKDDLQNADSIITPKYFAQFADKLYIEER